MKIQSELKAPKNQYNSFGKYKYRSCEDILEALKPILKKHNASITLSDSINECGGIVTIVTTATIMDNKSEQSVSVTACAGVDPSRKGMDIAQSFGSSSSYSRKYALNGLLLIDDTNDPDNTNDHKTTYTEKAKLDISDDKWEDCLKYVVDNKHLGFDGVIERLKKKYILSAKAIKTIKTYV